MITPTIIKRTQAPRQSRRTRGRNIIHACFLNEKGGPRHSRLCNQPISPSSSKAINSFYTSLSFALGALFALAEFLITLLLRKHSFLSSLSFVESSLESFLAELATLFAIRPLRVATLLRRAIINPRCEGSEGCEACGLPWPLLATWRAAT